MRGPYERDALKETDQLLAYYLGNPLLRFGISENAECCYLLSRPGRHLFHHGQHQFAVTVIQAHGVAADLGKKTHLIFGKRRKVLGVAVGKMVGKELAEG